MNNTKTVNLVQVLEILESIDIQLEGFNHQNFLEPSAVLAKLMAIEHNLFLQIEKQRQVQSPPSEVKREEQVLEKVRRRISLLASILPQERSLLSTDTYSPFSFIIPRKDQRIISIGPPEISDEEIIYNPATDYIGEGSYGIVYKGVCRGKKVAIKVPKKKLNPREIEEFKQEITFMSKIFHPNIVLFMGACTKPTIKIVTELCVTDVATIIRSNKEIKLYDRIKMAKGAAQGMNWLHGICKILHRDLKTTNLLIAEDGTAKVTDFGFSQFFEVGKTFAGRAKGTPLWMAPEVMMESETNEKRDVYSFGIILWELLTRKVPYSEYNNWKEFKHAVCVKGIRPEIPDGTTPGLQNLMNHCWAADYKQRLSFSEIISQLNEILVDCVITNKHGRSFWKNNFLLKGDNLEESCSWSKFTLVLGLTASEEVYLRALKCYVLSSHGPEKNEVTATEPVVTMESLNLAITWFGPFVVPEYGKHILRNIHDITSQPYFHKNISKIEAVSLLQNQPKGTFLVRLSSTTAGKPFTLSYIISRTAVDHRRISQKHPGRTDQSYSVRIDQIVYTCPTLPALVEDCKKVLNLLQPCPTEIVPSEYMS